MVEYGNKIVVTGLTLQDVDYEMPTPRIGGMSIFGKDINESYIDAFIDGRPVQFYTATEDFIEIEFGGEVSLTYFVTEESCEEYEITLEDYEEFIEFLKGLGGNLKIEKMED